jgi:hypothetical protein
MKQNPSFYFIILVLVVVDAWLLAHPNLLGKLGILFFKYDMIKTFPRALATVGLTTIAAAAIAIFIKRTSRQTALLVLGLLTIVSVGLLINTYFKFSAGSYAMTGSGFKTGALLTPIILILVFGNGVYEASKLKKV